MLSAEVRERMRQIGCDTLSPTGFQVGDGHQKPAARAPAYRPVLCRADRTSSERCASVSGAGNSSHDFEHKHGDPLEPPSPWNPITCTEIVYSDKQFYNQTLL
jgi:hypothetical protein